MKICKIAQDALNSCWKNLHTLTAFSSFLIIGYSDSDIYNETTQHIWKKPFSLLPNTFNESLGKQLKSELASRFGVVRCGLPKIKGTSPNHFDTIWSIWSNHASCSDSCHSYVVLVFLHCTFWHYDSKSPNSEEFSRGFNVSLKWTRRIAKWRQ